ncbi:MAG TPA: hypothetical protein ACFCUY_08765 [Xenococcaceae cyanobacterium]
MIKQLNRCKIPVLLAITGVLLLPTSVLAKSDDAQLDEWAESCQLSGAEVIIDYTGKEVYCAFDDGQDDIECQIGEGCYTVTVIEERINPSRHFPTATPSQNFPVYDTQTQNQLGW